jgi:DNA primase
MKIENIAFPEAVRSLASRYGVTIPESAEGNKKEKDEREVLYELNRSAAEFFESQLHHPQTGLRAREYLQMRGISLETAKRFSLGFAPDSWDACLNFFRKKGASLDLLGKAGIIKSSETGEKLFDRFRSRIIFPFHDARGRLVGFGGRLLEDDKNAPKYLNSPETLVYKKGKILYGIYFSGKGIQETGFATIVEGYFDFLTAFQNGIENVVANSGTAFTEDQVTLLKRYTENVTMIFDADRAGKAASERGFEVLLKQGIRAKVAGLPEGEDPDSYLRKFGSEKFNAMLKDAKPFIEQLICSALAEEGMLDSTERKTWHANKILEFIRKIPSNIEKNEYLNILSERLRISEKALQSDLLKFPGNRSERNPEPLAHPRKKGRASLAEQCERGLVLIMIQHPEKIKKVREKISLQDFKDSDLHEIASVLLEQDNIESAVTVDKIIERLSTGDQKAIVGALAMEPVEYEDLDRTITDFVKGMKKKDMKDRLHEIQMKKSYAVKMLNASEFSTLKENESALRRDLN